MVFNGSYKIKDNGKDYVVLADYESEGLSVCHQATTLEEVLHWMMANNYGSPQTLVRLVRVEMREECGIRDLIGT